MSFLFRPLSLRGLVIPNRIVISPMCQYSAVDGKATSWHTMHIGSMCGSGAGMFVIEATGVAPEGRITPHCLGIWNTETAEALGNVLKEVRKFHKMPIAIQLAHAGRKASTAAPWNGGKYVAPQNGGWIPIGPSAAESGAEAPVREMSLADIDMLKDQFVNAAKRANDIGIDAVELHAAHGYLLHSFLSPLSNFRTDQYGGNLENRMRLVLEVFDAVRQVWPAEKPLGVRISATDWVPGGWDLAQSTELAKHLSARNCDWLDVSTGGLSPLQQIPAAPGFQVPFASSIRAAVPNLPVIAVGLITDPQQAEQIVAQGEADMVAVARAMLFDPHWPWKAAHVLGAKIKDAIPNQYIRGIPKSHIDIISS